LSRTVYTEGTWDLFHYNHLEMLKECLAFGDRLVVGVVPDDEAVYCKRRPILNEQERLRTIAALPFVDHAFILEEPLAPARMEALIGRFKPVAVVYNSPGFDDYFAPAERLGLMRRLPYRDGITSSEIISRVLRNGQNGP
jgi:cytidyltransferase-like protein